MFETDPLCVCGHGPHTNRKCSDCGHPTFVRTDVAIAQALTSLAMLVKIADVVGSRWLDLTGPDPDLAPPAPEPPSEPPADPVPDNLSPLFPSKLSAALKEADHGKSEAEPPLA